MPWSDAQFKAASKLARNEHQPGLTLATLTMRREGLFKWHVAGKHHCGANSALVPVKRGEPLMAIPIRYTMTVACAPTLDHRGFLFDQAMVQLWFERQGLTPTALSCEALVIKAANELQDKIARDTPHCNVRGLTLQFSPAPFQASISAHYVKEQP